MGSFNVFVWGLVALVCFSHTLNNFKGVMGFHKIFKDLQNISATEIQEAHRTGYHFQPKQNWINGKVKSWHFSFLQETIETVIFSNIVY